MFRVLFLTKYGTPEAMIGNDKIWLILHSIRTVFMSLCIIEENIIMVLATQVFSLLAGPDYIRFSIFFISTRSCGSRQRNTTSSGENSN